MKFLKSCAPTLTDCSGRESAFEQTSHGVYALGTLIVGILGMGGVEVCHARVHVFGRQLVSSFKK